MTCSWWTLFLPLCLFWGCSLWQLGLQLCPEVWPQHLPPLCPHLGDRCAKHWGGPGHSAPPTATSATRSTCCWCLLHSTHTSCLHLQTHKSRGQLNTESWAHYQSATCPNYNTTVDTVVLLVNCCYTPNSQMVTPLSVMFRSWPPQQFFSFNLFDWFVKQVDQPMKMRSSHILEFVIKCFVSYNKTRISESKMSVD